MRAGRWELVRALGRGGMGEVWLGRDAAGQEAAIKLLPVDALDAEHRLRFAREGQALQRLRHAALVGWLETGETEGRPWIAMELVRGRSLEALVRERGPLPPREAASIARDLASGLAAAHAAGVLHRDVKPANVLFEGPERGDGVHRPRLVDFGLARPVARGASLTATGTIMGSPGFLAPEQVTGEKERQGPATDVYGLGATLYFLLTGAPPFEGPTAMASLEAVLREPPRPISVDRPDVPPALQALVLRCLAKSPAERPPSGQALEAALQGWLDRAPRRATWRGPLAVAAAVLLVSGAAALLPRGGSATRARDEALARGDAKAQARDHQGAIADFDQAIALDPRHAPAWASRGAARARLGQHQAAIADFDQAIALDPRYAPTWYDRGVARANLGQFQAAITDYDQVVALDPRHAPAWANRGAARASLGLQAAAIADLDRAIALDPRYAPAWANRGIARAQLGQHPAAIADYDRAIDLDPRYAPTWSNRGLSRTKLGEHQAAIADFDRAIDLDPRFALAYVYRGHARAKLGQLPDALADYDQAIDLDPRSAQTYLTRGNARAKLGELRDALVDYDRAIDLDPRSALAYLNRGVAYANLGQHQAAIADLERVLELEPQHERAQGIRQELARLRAQVGGPR